ncbi:hypothetical protein WOLCODRAFT_132443 [Wolfiporia cocos MD-104 SS10]|uniref:Mediator of RNA polymerase II transcription subunit 19 n=1 Tax=Wolfiporia cocos (strain MD-104) TaxID=742152 RepID=A0A2H3JK73_WOLCO|nr:hypothetical protein WOLCODRAFT_132443 [Wolfiporia cocos MD-104 SS10]
MKVDDELSKPALQPTNALAGPSTLPDIYLQPPGPPPPPPYLTSTQDLISRLNLLPAYNKYVRPYALPVGQQPPASAMGTDKGKGKEKDMSEGAVPGDGEEEEGKGEKRLRGSYRQLIKGIPGKHSIKKDEYLTTMMQVPPKQKIAITPFDLRTQREAFSVSLEGLKGWNTVLLVAETPQAREDRKKRRELKKQKLAKAQGQAALAGAGTPAATATPAAAAARTSTPRPGATAGRALPTVQQPRGRTPVGIGTPQSMATPGTAAAPTPASSAPSLHTGPATAPDAGMAKRGVKREREHSQDGVPVQISHGANVNGGAGVAPDMGANGSAAKASFVAGAKAGSAGVRPRPFKKPRLDATGTPNIPLQQPTPHA